jgi:hypothetical protein
MSGAGISFIVLTAIAAVVAAIHQVRKASQRTKLSRIAAVTIGSLAPSDAAVRVRGTVRAVDVTKVAGPYSGRPALGVVFERWAMSMGRRVQRLDRQVRHTPFLVEDDTGSIVLDLAHADFQLELHPAALASAGPTRVFGAGIIAANQQAEQDNLEGLVIAGDRITAAGRVVRGPDGRLALVGTAAAPLVVSDHPALLR